MQKQSLPFALALVIMLLLLSAVTLANIYFDALLGLTGVTLLYLLAVITAATFFEFLIAFITAVIAFLAINFFFTEPRYTFVVAHIQSWVSLCCFLIVSLLIASLVKQLKYQSQQALQASSRAQFSRILAERLALASDLNALFQETCQLLQHAFQHPIAIATNQADSTPTQTTKKTDYVLLQQSGEVHAPDQRLMQWVCENGKAISPYTNYWTDHLSTQKQWLIPLNRLPSHDPILIVDQIQPDEPIETFHAIKSCVDQISQAYQRLISSEKVQQAELIAKTETIQNALLASISHDMRTPLTSILGAATTMQQDHLAPEQYAQLSALIASQARYLANTTENILSLIRLEASVGKEIPMDWQSPEELIGIVSTLYKHRNEAIDLKVHCDTPDLLIKGNANLITQALVNLIENAKQANANHAPIEIIVTKMNNRIYISVNDRGIGVSKDFNAAKIKKFSSSHQTSSHKGFGLGLSIVQAIAQAHHALFTIENRLGGGVSATLSFPAPDLGELNVQ